MNNGPATPSSLDLSRRRKSKSLSISKELEREDQCSHCSNGTGLLSHRKYQPERLSSLFLFSYFLYQITHIQETKLERRLKSAALNALESIEYKQICYA